MRKIVALILTFILLFQGAGLGMEDVLLFGRLAEHAQYHSENYGDDFFTFFNKHYGNQRAEHAKNASGEHSDHEELPFQHHACNHSIAEVILTSYEFPLKKIVLTVRSTEQHFYYQNLYASLDRAAIFQPPRLA